MPGIGAICAKMTTFLILRDLTTAPEPQEVHFILLRRFYICRVVRLKRRGWAADISAGTNTGA